MDKKSKTAVISIFYALFLTLTKAIVGIVTQSLGILSEALHSLLDLFATVITFYSVKKSAKPADEEHHFGHEKVENLSALFQTLLLYFTSFFIVYEAVRRLIFTVVQIKVNTYSFLVIAVSIVVDYSRYRVLSKTAKETKSPALEADALHFSSDIGSSSVVLLGLLTTKLGFPQGDSISAIVVAMVVLYISTKLGLKSINSLLDTGPKGARERAEKMAKSVKGVSSVYDIKVREASDTTFVEMKISVDKDLPFEEVHRITSEVEDAILGAFGKSKVIIHPEPSQSKEGVYEVALFSAQIRGAKLHDFTLFKSKDGDEVSLHLEWNKDMVFYDAFKKSKEIECEIKRRFPSVKEIYFHIEPNFEQIEKDRGVDLRAIEKKVQNTLSTLEYPLNSAKVKILNSENISHIYLTFEVPSRCSVEEIHALSSKLERKILQALTENVHIIAISVPKEEK